MATKVSLKTGVKGVLSPENGGPDSGSIRKSYYASSATHYGIPGGAPYIIPLDDSIPQIGEGLQILSLTTGTLASTTNKLRIRVSFFATASAASWVTGTMFVNGGTNAVQATTAVCASAGWGTQYTMDYEYTPGTTAAQTISINVGPSGATNTYVNGIPSNRVFGGIAKATITVEEIVA